MTFSTLQVEEFEIMELPAHGRNCIAYSFYSLVNFYKGNLFTKKCSGT
jgi:hypothetical protein